MMRSRTPRMRWAVLCVALILMMAATAQAQSDRGSISGLVVDESGAAVPGVSVTARNVGTNAVSEATTNNEGLYSLRNLPIGKYSVNFSLEGFKPYTREGISIGLGEQVRLDHTLAVGGLQDAVTVVADADLLNTSNAEIGTSMTASTVRDLPLDISGGRSMLQFAYAVTPSVEGEGKGNTWDSHVAGGAEFTNEVVLDGTSAVIQIGGWVGESSPPMEAVEEFKVQTSGIPAEYGRTAGGVFNFSLKSGTNELHGSAFGSLRNEALNANTWQNNFLEATDPENAGDYGRAEDRQYLYGFSLGGPIIKDKTFFFASVEQYTQSRFVLGAFDKTVPIPAFLDGDFSALLNTAGSPLGHDPAGNPIYPGAIRDPLTGNVFPGNVIPQDRISDTSRQITDVYRQSYLPQVDRLTNNSSIPQYNSPDFAQRQYSIKVTHQFSPKSQLSGSFIYSKRPRTLVDAGGIWDQSDPNKLGGPLSKGRRQIVTSPQVRLHYSLTLSPSVLNVVNFSWSRYNNPSYSVGALGDTNFNQQLGFGDTGVNSFPTIEFGDGVNGVDITDIGYTNDNGYKSDVFIVADSLSWVTGRHSFKFGGEYRQMKTTSWTNTGALNFDFSPEETRFLGQPWSNQTGFGFASFLLGGVHNADMATPGNLTGGRNYVALFAQDDFRVNDKLTLNLGLRWETTGPWSEKNGHWANFNTTAINPVIGIPGVLEYAQDSSTTFEGPRDWTQFGPRVGLTYQPSERAVIRAAYGIFYQPIGMDYWFGVPYTFAPGFRSTNIVNPVGGGNPAFNWDGGYPGVDVPGSQDPNYTTWGMVSMSPEGLSSGRIQQWNAGVDFELTKDLVVGVNYLGNKGTRLNSGDFQRNQPDMQAVGDLVRSYKEWNWVWDEASAADAGVPYPYPGFSNFAGFALAPFPTVAETWGPLYFVGSPLGSQSYNALQLTLNKRRSHGFTAYASYTYSRARGNMATGFQERWDVGPIQDVNNLSMEAGVISRFDRAHILKGYLAWELPFGQGRKWMNSSGWKDALFGGWEVSLIFRYDSGVPLAINSNAYYFPWSGYPIYVNRDPSVNLDSQFEPGSFDMGNPGVASNRYFDASAFSNPAYGDFGQGPGRFEQLRSFGGAYEDLGLLKTFSIGSRVRAQLRLELINLFNRHYFDDPITDIGSEYFGQVISTGGTPRQGQVALRFEW
jgi:hypothetical protein